MSVHSCSGCGGPTRRYVEVSCVGCGRVSLHDVDDALAFVQATINKSGLRLSPEQRGELAAEGLDALVKLARDYQPGKGGLDAANSRFSGYAAKYLPGKLSDRWHRLEQHTLATQPDGSRQWEIHQKPASLSALDGDGDEPGGLDRVRSLQWEDRIEPESLADLPQLLSDWWDERCRQVTRYMELLAEGYRNGEVLMEMQLLPSQLKEIEGFAREITRRLRREASGLRVVA